jgi:hypothetical protein
MKETWRSTGGKPDPRMSFFLRTLRSMAHVGVEKGSNLDILTAWELRCIPRGVYGRIRAGARGSFKEVYGYEVKKLKIGLQA